MDLIQILISVAGMSNVIYQHRSKIYNKLSRSKVGLWLMSPIMVPYIIYGLIKLVKDPDFSAMMDKWNKQKKLDDFS